ncbi:hypothetical protein [Pseudomonas fluorescens]|jgi:hypothetical protein|uniref:hypothetical protein n=1 Tax=Pseudomonas fluorescens TaxID=294 RepID=UPI0020C5B10E|nr:hypothetical protein [Pseudomonas fluorescens]UTL92226.1 hypothetical protein NLL86_05630 [Pseudomonas fluorescens]
MNTRAELIVAVIDKAAKPISQTGAAAAIHDQFTTDKTGFSLVVQTAQTTTAIASVVSITHFPIGAVPFINIVTNTLAGTVTFLKIAADFKEGVEIKGGDVISLAGNVAGIVASFAILAGAPFIAGGATVFGISATVYSIVSSDLAQAAYDKMAPLFTSLLSQGDLTGFIAPRIAPDFTLASPDQILSIHQGMITTVNWNPDSSEISLGTEPLSFRDSSQAHTDPTGSETFNSTQPPPLTGNSSSVSVAVTPTPDIPAPDATLTISIESIDGVNSPDPAPSITVPIDDNQDNQDNYICCSSAQQDQYF